jgi:hypothetical protein
VWHQKKKEEAEIDTLPCRYCVRGHISDPFLFGFLLLLPQDVMSAFGSRGRTWPPYLNIFDETTDDQTLVTTILVASGEKSQTVA